jgi:hypothetical protein
LLVQGDARNPTFRNGALLQKGQRVQLSNGDRLRFGRAEATFHVNKQVRLVDSGVLDLRLGPPQELRVEPGSEQSSPLSLVNFSGQVDHFGFDLTGLPPGWWRVVMPGMREGTSEVRLMTTNPPQPAPDATANGMLVCSPPRQSDARAGAYPFAVSATSQSDPPLRRTIPGQLVVMPYHDTRMAAEKPRLRGGRGGFALLVSNLGNEPTSVTLSVPEHDKLVCKFDHPEITLENGAETRVTLDARVKRRPWFGGEVTHSVDVSASGVPGVAKLWLVCPPIIPEWLQVVLRRLQAMFVRPILVPVISIALILAMAYVFLRPPEVYLVASPSLVGSGGAVTVSWSVQRGVGNVTLENGGASQQADQRGTQEFKADQDATIKVTARNLFGLTSSDSTSIKVVKVASFTAAPDSIKAEGDEVTLQWATQNATGVIIEPASDELKGLPASGKVVVHPKASTTYRLVAVNDLFNARTAPVEAAVRFGAPKISQFQPDKQQAFPGDRVQLTWAADGFSRLLLKAETPDLELTEEQDVSRRTSFQVRPLKSGDYRLLAVNADGTSVEARLTMTVAKPGAPRLQAPAKPISAGESVLLQWQLEGVNERTTLTLSPDVGDVTGKMGIEVRPGHTTRYTLTLGSPDGSAVTSAPIEVAVLPAVKQFTVAPGAIVEGEPVVLNWVVDDAEQVTVLRDGIVIARGSGTDDARDHPTASTRAYVLRARNATGEAAEVTAPITVAAPTPVPTPVPPTPVPPPAAPALPPTVSN